jgi:hypothetical protein
LELAGVEVAIVERRASQDLEARAEAVCTHAPSRFSISAESLIGSCRRGRCTRAVGFSHIPLDISDAPTRHNHALGPWQNRFEEILAGWVGELAVPIHVGLR